MTTRVIHLHAESKWGVSGQYIARIIGRAAKYTFNRSFVGSRSGKRREDTIYDTDEPGLFEVCDVTRHGKSKGYFLILPFGDGLYLFRSDLEDAMAIAKRIDAHETLDSIVVVERGELATNADGTPKLKDDGTPAHKLVYVLTNPKTEAVAS